MRSLIKQILDDLNLSCSKYNEIQEKVSSLYDGRKTILLVNRKDKVDFYDIKDVCYINKVSNKETQVFVGNEPLFHYDKKVDLIELLPLNDDRFLIADKKTVINIHKVQFYDSCDGIVYFGDDIERCLKVKVFKTFVNTVVKSRLGNGCDVTPKLDSIFYNKSRQATF